MTFQTFRKCWRIEMQTFIIICHRTQDILAKNAKLHGDILAQTLEPILALFCRHALSKKKKSYQMELKPHSPIP